MAEPDTTGLDGRLRDALGRAAEPGDPTGVADAIRARVAAGDPGASVAASSAPGWGAGAGAWMPWLGLVVVGALVGGGLGVSGAVGRPAGDTVADVPVAIGDAAPAYSCVDGPRIGRLGAGTRVLAVQRSDDSLWVGVRDPEALGSTVWVELGDVSLDDAEALDALPVGGACPETLVVVPAPEPEPEPTEEPAPGPNPPPNPEPGDMTPPMFQQTAIAGNGCGYEVQAVVSDNVGATGVRISWTGLNSGANQPMTLSGGTWRFVYTAPDPSYGTVNFTLVARDAAGNESSTNVSRNDMGCFG